MKLKTEVVEVPETDPITGEEKNQIHFTDDRRYTVCGMKIETDHRWVFKNILQHRAFQTHDDINCPECKEYVQRALGFFSTPINAHLGLKAPTEVDHIIDAFQIETLAALVQDGDIRKLNRDKVSELVRDLLKEFNPDNTGEAKNRIIARNLNRIGDTLIKVDYGQGLTLTTVNDMLWECIVEFRTDRFSIGKRKP